MKILTESAGAAEYTDWISANDQDTPNLCPGYDTKKNRCGGSSNAGTLGNAGYPFIAIAPRFTLARSGNTR